MKSFIGGILSFYCLVAVSSGQAAETFSFSIGEVFAGKLWLEPFAHSTVAYMEFHFQDELPQQTYLDATARSEVMLPGLQVWYRQVGQGAEGANKNNAAKLFRIPLDGGLYAYSLTVNDLPQALPLDVTGFSGRSSQFNTSLPEALIAQERIRSNILNFYDPAFFPRNLKLFSDDGWLVEYHNYEKAEYCRTWTLSFVWRNSEQVFLSDAFLFSPAENLRSMTVIAKYQKKDNFLLNYTVKIANLPEMHFFRLLQDQEREPEQHSSMPVTKGSQQASAARKNQWTHLSMSDSAAAGWYSGPEESNTNGRATNGIDVKLLDIWVRSTDLNGIY